MPEYKKHEMHVGSEPDPAAPPSRIMQGGLPNFNHSTFVLSTQNNAPIGTQSEAVGAFVLLLRLSLDRVGGHMRTWYAGHGRGEEF